MKYIQDIKEKMYTLWIFKTPSLVWTVSIDYVYFENQGKQSYIQSTPPICIQ
jgi:hypothetical protein